ncbi:MAG: peptidoglycan-binding protein LysM [Winogradskyella sp.]|uniref:peptidoglycan-binding protein LysM n=1 Tax=Winogradskyella sp. TaxID=1883156 RepID=UPI000F3EF8F4|nr:peptidoglycan-binding protein LysM [Winogradskyella sp.]RNC79778.1 MAG: peptidoglycan-binding protein LysM [Winogradskyella sp.]
MYKKIVSNVIGPFAVCFLIALALYPTTIINPEQYSTDGLELDFDTPKNIAKVEKKDTTETESVFTPDLGTSFEAFKEALAFKESQGNYFTVNTFGYMGKYQFGKETLKMIGIYNPNQFLNTPELQEKAFIAYTKRNKWILRRDIERFTGKTISGVEITESGILAAAHLAGAGSVKKFLRSYGSNNFADGYGSTVRYYMKRFAGYDTSFIEPDKRAKVSI